MINFRKEEWILVILLTYKTPIGLIKLKILAKFSKL